MTTIHLGHGGCDEYAGNNEETFEHDEELRGPSSETRRLKTRELGDH